MCPHSRIDTREVLLFTLPDFQIKPSYWLINQMTSFIWKSMDTLGVFLALVSKHYSRALPNDILSRNRFPTSTMQLFPISEILFSVKAYALSNEYYLKRMVKKFSHNLTVNNFLWNRSLYFFWSFLYLFNPNDFNFIPKRSIKMFVNHKFWVIDQSNNFFMICLLYLFHCCDRPTKGSVE